VNLLCLVGVIVGIISLLSVWLIIDIHISSDTPPLEVHTGLDLVLTSDYLTFAPGHSWSIGPYVHPIMLVYVLGIIISLSTPLGGTIQLLAISALYLTNPPFPNSRLFEIQIGVYIGILSAAIVLLSFLYPVGLNLERLHGSRLNRLITIAKGSPRSVELVKTEKKTDSSKGRMHSMTGRQIKAMLIACILVVPVILILNDYYSQPYSTLVFSVSSKGANNTGIIIYLDGVGISASFFGSDEYVHEPNGTILGPARFYYAISAGAHVVGYDFGMSEWAMVENLSIYQFADGVIDRTVTLSVAPLATEIVSVMIP